MHISAPTVASRQQRSSGYLPECNESIERELEPRLERPSEAKSFAAMAGQGASSKVTRPAKSKVLTRMWVALSRELAGEMQNPWATTR
jgi:hypothetical protein